MTCSSTPGPFPARCPVERWHAREERRDRLPGLAHRGYGLGQQPRRHTGIARVRAHRDSGHPAHGDRPAAEVLGERPDRQGTGRPAVDLGDQGPARRRLLHPPLLGDAWGVEGQPQHLPHELQVRTVAGVHGSHRDGHPHASSPPLLTTFTTLVGSPRGFNGWWWYRGPGDGPGGRRHRRRGWPGWGRLIGTSDRGRQLRTDLASNRDQKVSPMPYRHPLVGRSAPDIRAVPGPRPQGLSALRQEE